MKSPCLHRPNGLGARNEYGWMVCGQCGHGYDDRHPLDDPETRRRLRRKMDDIDAAQRRAKAGARSYVVGAGVKGEGRE